jgi:hypothetical protein
VIKLENQTDNVLKDMAAKLDLYKREYYFYNNVSDYVDIKHPKCYQILKDKSFRSIGVLLQDLTQIDNMCLNPDLNTLSIDVSLSIIDSLAQLHAKFWNKNIDEHFPSINNKKYYTIMGDLVKSQWEPFKNKWCDVLSSKQLEIGSQIVKSFDNIIKYASNTNLTVCHGDVKSGNIFYDLTNNTPYFIDWQYINHGKGVSDIVFFMIESFEIEKLDMCKDLFIQYYYLQLQEYGVNDYTKKDYLRDFKLSACVFPFFVGVWFGVLPKEQLPDPNFPFFYIQRLFNFLEVFDCTNEIYTNTHEI